jgi:hypothetical protein
MIPEAGKIRLRKSVNCDGPMDRTTDLRAGLKNRPSQTGHSVCRKSRTCVYFEC